MTVYTVYVCPECGQQLDSASKRGCAHWPRHCEVSVVPRSVAEELSIALAKVAAGYPVSIADQALSRYRDATGPKP